MYCIYIIPLIFILGLEEICIHFLTIKRPRIIIYIININKYSEIKNYI